MVDALPLLVGALGGPVDEIREHGDLPYGYGDLDSTVRRVGFGGLYVWPSCGRPCPRST